MAGACPGRVGLKSAGTVRHGPRMTQAQKLAVRLSEVREKLNQLSGKDELSEAEETEMRTLSAEYPALEARHRAAMIGESAEEAAAAGEDHRPRRGR